MRSEILDGCEGGACEINGQKILFLDLTMSAPDQFEQILDGLLLHLDKITLHDISLPMRYRLAQRQKELGQTENIISIPVTAKED